MPREVPTDGECFRIGLISLCSWVVVFPLSLSCYKYSTNRYTKRIFLALALLCILEIPWATQLAVNRRYTGQITYSIHLLSSITYFFAFCTFCFAINDVLRSGEFGGLYVGTIKRRRVRIAMICVNIMTLIVIFGAICVLLSSDDLEDFLSKPIYKAFVLFNTLEMMVLGLFIGAFVTSLRGKVSPIKNPLNLTKNRSTSAELARTKSHNKKMIAVTNKLSLMLLIFVILFSLNVLRVAWWLSPSNPRYSVDVLAPQSLDHIDFWWWLIFSLFPRILPPYVFILSMGWPSRYFFQTLIPDEQINSNQSSSTLYDDNSRPRQGSEDSDVDGDDAMNIQIIHGKSRSKDFSVDSDDAGHFSNLMNNRISFLNEELLDEREQDLTIYDVENSMHAKSSYIPPQDLDFDTEQV